MKHMGFKSKVESLEQLTVEFDDAKSTDNQGALPQQVNSKKKFDIGPTNNARQVYSRRNPVIKQEAKGGTTFGFVAHDNSSHDEDEEEKKDGSGGSKWREQGLVNRIYQPAQMKQDSQRHQVDMGS